MAEITATVRPTREEVVPSRKRVKLPAWLKVAKPRLIPLLLATTLVEWLSVKAGRSHRLGLSAPWGEGRLPPLLQGF